MIYHVVIFHADGGQMCTRGIRCYTDKQEADKLAENLRREVGHTCGSESVRQRESEVPIENEGYFYPSIANRGR